VAQWSIIKALQEDNRIYINAIFLFIKKVVFDVEKTCIGKKINYDKLILRMYTDSSENLVDIVYYAIYILRTQLEHFLISTKILFNDILVIS